MIEAVNSVLVNAQVLRSSVEQTAASRSFAANPDRVQEVATPKAPFISPYISVDVNFNKAVLQIRDSETGDVVNQFPSESRLRQLRDENQVKQEAATPRSGRDTTTTSSRSFASVGDTASIGVSSTSSARSEIGVADVAQAQMASAALSAGAQTAAQTISAGVNVQA